MNEERLKKKPMNIPLAFRNGTSVPDAAHLQIAQATCSRIHDVVVAGASPDVKPMPSLWYI